MMHIVIGLIVLVLLPVEVFSQSTPVISGLSPEDSLLVEQAEFTPPPDSLFTVDDVVVVGNEKTEAYVLLREMRLRQGEYITDEAMEYDKKRIYSLALFTRVEMGYIPTQTSRARLVVLVGERWYIYPFPIVGIKDRDWKKFYLGGGITHQNFRGRNEKVYVAFTLFYDPAVILSYRNPLIDAENSYFLSAGIAWRVVRNRSLLAIGSGPNYDERHLSLSLDLGKRVDLAHTVWFSAAYEMVKVFDYLPGRTISTDGTDAFPIFGIGYVYDTRDLQEYAMHGSFTRTTITKYGFPGGTVDFIRYALDFRRFIPVTPRLTLAGRFFTDISAGGQIPVYNRAYLGYGERIRGHFTDVYEGEQQLGASVELRFMLLEPRYIVAKFIPVPEFAVWKFGIAAALFGDAGRVWFRNNPLALNQFVKGYGFGLHFLLPYGLVLRTELAFDELRRSQFIFDVSAVL